MGGAASDGAPSDVKALRSSSPPNVVVDGALLNRLSVSMNQECNVMDTVGEQLTEMRCALLGASLPEWVMEGPWEAHFGEALLQ